mmetsp:Transcript_13207/g.22461  ORF Transcript_13207/g.22461 Transcript_13207/m.22461 type:complete len:429 (-) Transcript_13207:58-1344(-)
MPFGKKPDSRPVSKKRRKEGHMLKNLLGQQFPESADTISSIIDKILARKSPLSTHDAKKLYSCVHGDQDILERILELGTSSGLRLWRPNSQSSEGEMGNTIRGRMLLHGVPHEDTDASAQHPIITFSIIGETRITAVARNQADDGNSSSNSSSSSSSPVDRRRPPSSCPPTASYPSQNMDHDASRTAIDSNHGFSDNLVRPKYLSTDMDSKPLGKRKTPEQGVGISKKPKCLDDNNQYLVHVVKSEPEVAESCSHGPSKSGGSCYLTEDIVATLMPAVLADCTYETIRSSPMYWVVHDFQDFETKWLPDHNVLLAVLDLGELMVGSIVLVSDKLSPKLCAQVSKFMDHPNPRSFCARGRVVLPRGMVDPRTVVGFDMYCKAQRLSSPPIQGSTTRGEPKKELTVPEQKELVSVAFRSFLHPRRPWGER